MILLVAALACAQTAPATPKSLSALLDDVRAKTGIPGIAAAAVRDGKIVAVGASGVRELGKPEPVAVGDRFLVGSCTKAMTRLLLARLVEDGKIAADATLPDLLPGVAVREEYRKATLGDLMRHKAGIPPYTEITPARTPIVFELTGTPTEQRAKFAEHVMQEAPAGAVGKDFVYSNAGYALLGCIAEKKVGAPWEELVEKHVFQPLGMRAVRIGLPRGKDLEGMPVGHARTSGGYEVEKNGPAVAGVFAPAGGAVLSIEDFARFAIGAIAAEPKDGKGLLPKSEEGETFFGGQGTYTAACTLWPSRGFGIVVGTNGGESDDACAAAVEAIRAAHAPDIASASGPVRITAGGRVLGVQMRTVPGESMVIVRVEPGSLAEKGGLKVDDELVAVDGKPLADWDEAAILPAIKAPKAKLTVMREGKKVDLVMPE